MSALEIVLAASTGVLAVAFVVTAAKLVRARRQVADLQKPMERSRLVPTPSEAVRTVVGTAMRVRDRGLSGAIRSSIDDLALWADVERPDLARLASDDGTVTILFSDIQDSTALNHRLGDRGWVQLLAKHDRVLKRAIEAHAGHVIKTQGDGFMVAFAEGSEAVDAACDIQRDRPPAWCEAHHLNFWSEDGPTDLDNAALFCFFHHHLLHEGNWHATMAHDGIVEVIPPADVDPDRIPRRHNRFTQISPRAA